MVLISAATPLKESLRTLATGSCSSTITSGNRVRYRSISGGSSIRSGSYKPRISELQWSMEMITGD